MSRFTIHCTGVNRFVVHEHYTRSRPIRVPKRTRKYFLGFIPYWSYHTVLGTVEEKCSKLLCLSDPGQDGSPSTSFTTKEDAKRAIDSLLAHEERARKMREKTLRFIEANPPEGYP